MSCVETAVMQILFTNASFIIGNVNYYNYLGNFFPNPLSFFSAKKKCATTVGYIHFCSRGEKRRKKSFN